MSLKIYHQKRDFSKTPEPKGFTNAVKKPRLFVVQKHAASHLHYDFRLELHGVLKSWAVPKGPSLDPDVKRLAMEVEDHPVEYGDFEGIIPKGQYGGGTVMLWDEGQWVSEDENPMRALKEGHLTFRLKGKKLKGLWKLIRMKNTTNSWLLIKIQDDYAKHEGDYSITEKKTKSVSSGRSMDAIAKNYDYVWGPEGKSNNCKKNKVDIQEITLNLPKSRMPDFVFPQLATLVDRPPIGDEWIHEIKFDGYRLIAIKRNKTIRLLTRRNNDWTDLFKNVVTALKKLPVKNAILDGEITVLDHQQKTNFQLLQNSLKQNKNNFVYFLFDIMYYDHYDVMPLTLMERKSILKQLLINNRQKALRFSEHIQGSGMEVFKKSCELGLEGIISKNINCPYIQKRTKNLLKVKCIKSQEFVIGGYTLPKGNRRYFGSLLLGTFNKKKELIYRGHVGTGFTEKSLRDVYAQLKKNETDESPFAQRPPASSQVIWVKPILAAEVNYSEITSDGILRTPSFKGLRQDKSIQDIIMEKPFHTKQLFPRKTKRLNLSLSNPQKILYPEDHITKQEVAEYYLRISKLMLPYIKNRPLTLLRCPENFNECFYQRHFYESFADTIFGFDVQTKDEIEKYLYIKNAKGLLELIQLNVLEIHPWGSTIKKIDNPDIIIFDMDPAPDVAWKEVVQAAKTVRDFLKDLQLISFIKTTGGKGLHVVVPIKPKNTWDEVKNFAHVFVDFIVSQNPKKYVGQMTKSKRHGKIFIDYLRNSKSATAIAPYSTRARTHAPIAVPLFWDELTNQREDTNFTIKNIDQRLNSLKKDPWEDFFQIKQKLNLKDFK